MADLGQSVSGKVYKKQLKFINIQQQLKSTQVKMKKLVPWGTDGLLPLSDLDLGSGHTAHRRASVIDLYLHTKFH